jgi:hypothetical protein
MEDITLRRSGTELREIAKNSLSMGDTIESVERAIDQLNGDPSNYAWEKREILLCKRAFLNGPDSTQF